MARIRFVSNDTGYATTHEVPTGTTLEQFISDRLNGANPADYTIRVNRQEMEAGYLLQDEQCVSCTPRNVKAA